MMFCFTDLLGSEKGIPPFEQEKGYRLLKPIITSPVEHGISIAAAIKIITVCKQQHVGISLSIFKSNLQI